MTKDFENWKHQKKSEIVKVLGLRWDTNNDTLAFAKNERLDVNLEKREVLKLSSKIYDPLVHADTLYGKSSLGRNTTGPHDSRMD